MSGKKWKYIGVFGSAMILIAAVYIQVWFQSYNQANIYFNEAMQKYNAGQYTFALKGERVSTPKGTYFSGGFQQVLETWESPYAIPKPGLMKKASTKIDDIINNKLTLDQDQQAFKAYYGLDNRFLGRIVVRMGDIYAEQGDNRDAEDMYNTALQAFPLDKQLVAECNKKIEKLKKKN